MNRKTITIKDVAKAAGVSTATVSRALSNPKSVTQATRSSVLEAAKATGYQINLAARNLRTRQTRVIVVLVPNIGNPFFSHILAGIETVASASEMNVLIVDTGQPEERGEIVRRYLSTAQADGIITLDGSLPTGLLEELHSQENSPPFVFACEWEPLDLFPSVRTDNVNGARMAVAHLLELGHRDIGYINGPPENVLSTARLEGAKLGLAKAKLPLRDAWTFNGDFSIESGVQAARNFIGLHERPTGVFCASDLMAIGFISELKRNGLETPSDVSVVSFDDIDIAAHFIPPLTTIRQPRELIGTTVTSLLIEAIRKEAHEVTRQPVVLPVELIVRESTARRT